MKNGLVTILSANYNNGDFLDDYFDSILSQSFSNYEVVFVDDCSSDNSIEIANSYSEFFDGKLKIISLGNNVGFANALNVGLKHCKGEFIARIDPDDVMDKDRLKIQYDLITSGDSYDIVGSNAIYFQGEISNSVGSSNFLSSEQWISNKYKSSEHGLMHGTVMLRQSIMFDNAYNQSNVPAEDYDLFSRLIINGARCINVIKPLTYVRIHENSVSNYLPFTTIAKTFLLCNHHFGKSYSLETIAVKYLHIKYYRFYLFESSRIKKLVYLLFSVSFAPVRSLSILFRKFGKKSV